MPSSRSSRCRFDGPGIPSKRFEVAGAAWALATFPRTDFAELMRLMGTPQQPGMPDFAAIYQGPWFLAWIGILWAGVLGYLLFVRRYLR